MKLYLSWNDIKRDCNILAGHIRNQSWFDEHIRLIAVTRGGLFIAGFLSQILNIKRIETICVESYSEENIKGEVKIIHTPNFFGKPFLIVDDLVDSGGTFEAIQEAVREPFYSAVLYVKPDPDTGYYPTVSVASVGDDWIVFPWEVEPPDESGISSAYDFDGEHYG